MDEFSSHTNIAWNGHVGRVEYGGDRNMVAMFYNKSVHNPAKSQETGRPFYEDKVFVRIHPPGERLNIVDRPANESDRRRWPIQWAQFQENKQQVPEGTPIDLLYPDHPSIAATLRASGVYTVEQCAELSGPAIDQIGMGGQRWCNDAQKYLEQANKGVKATQLRAELEERDSEIRTLKHQIELMREEMVRMQQASASFDVGQLQALLAGAQGRPQFPTATRQLAPQFDVQTAQINATHKTADIAQQRKGTRKRPRLDT